MFVCSHIVDDVGHGCNRAFLVAVSFCPYWLQKLYCEVMVHLAVGLGDEG